MNLDAEGALTYSHQRGPAAHRLPPHRVGAFARDHAEVLGASRHIAEGGAQRGRRVTVDTGEINVNFYIVIDV